MRRIGRMPRIERERRRRASRDSCCSAGFGSFLFGELREGVVLKQQEKHNAGVRKHGMLLAHAVDLPALSAASA
jgi:hypothetical protein